MVERRLVVLEHIKRVCLLGGALALLGPEGLGQFAPNWYTYDEIEACCYTNAQGQKVRQMVTVGRLKPGYEFRATEVTDLENWFVQTYGNHVRTPFIAHATRTYNCHGYAFGQVGVIFDPGNFLGPNHPCYIESPHGPVYRWGSAHSAIGSPYTQYPYRAKMGQGPLGDHDAYTGLYGPHSSRWGARVRPPL